VPRGQTAQYHVECEDQLLTWPTVSRAFMFYKFKHWIYSVLCGRFSVPVQEPIKLQKTYAYVLLLSISGPHHIMRLLHGMVESAEESEGGKRRSFEECGDM
jgi:hypothetical protein